MREQQEPLDNLERFGRCLSADFFQEIRDPEDDNLRESSGLRVIGILSTDPEELAKIDRAEENAHSAINRFHETYVEMS